MEIAARLSRLAALFRAPSAPTPRVARGTADRSNPNIRRIVVSVDRATFERLCREATAAGISLTEAIRRTLRDGLAAKRARDGGER